MFIMPVLLSFPKAYIILGIALNPQQMLLWRIKAQTIWVIIHEPPFDTQDDEKDKEEHDVGYLSTLLIFVLSCLLDLTL